MYTNKIIFVLIELHSHRSTLITQTDDKGTNRHSYKISTNICGDSA